MRGRVKSFINHQPGNWKCTLLRFKSSASICWSYIKSTISAFNKDNPTGQTLQLPVPYIAYALKILACITFVIYNEWWYSFVLIYLRQEVYVSVPVCLFVCLLARQLKKLWTFVNEIFMKYPQQDQMLGVIRMDVWCRCGGTEPPQQRLMISWVIF